MKDDRIPEIDDIKSALVLIMLLYHAASALPSAAARNAFAGLTENLYFIHFAFVLVCGLLCGLHYNTPTQLNTRPVRAILAMRGVKLFGIFLAINLLLYATGYFHWHGWANLRTMNPDFPFGLSGQTVALEILYYIGWVLILSAGLLSPVPWWIVLLLGLAAIPFEANSLIFCMGWGCVGMGLGGWLHTGFGEGYGARLRRYCRILPPLLILYLILANILHWPHRSYALLLETFLWFGSFIWLLGIGGPGRHLKLFARYTLPAYIGQIVILSLLQRTLSRCGLPSGAVYGIGLAVGTVLLLLMLAMLDQARRRFGRIDRMYRMIFN